MVSTPPLPVTKARYVSDGMARVHGWLNPSTGVYLACVEALQQRAGVTGDVCEIGVHHGKSFLTLALGLPPGQRAVAVDVFGDQAANLDNSGRGDRAAFERNLAEHGLTPGAVEVIEASSLDLERRGFVAAGRRFRLFSIDGGHTAQVTRNDLELAERTVVGDGVVVLDDVLNRHWLGVITGLFDYWAAGGTLVPAALVPNKLLLTPTAESARALRKEMAEEFAAALEKTEVPLGDHTIDVFGEYPFVVTDETGRQSLVVGAGAPTSGSAASKDTVTSVPKDYLAELERRAAWADQSLHRELRRRYPRYAWATARTRSAITAARRGIRRITS